MSHLKIDELSPSPLRAHVSEGESAALTPAQMKAIRGGIGEVVTMPYPVCGTKPPAPQPWPLPTDWPWSCATPWPQPCGPAVPGSGEPMPVCGPSIGDGVPLAAR